MIDIGKTLYLHSLWLQDNRCGAQADLSYLKLGSVDFTGVDLRYAILIGVNLQGSCLNGANLYRAMLQGADLRRTHMYRTKLSCANLTNAKLSRSNLISTKMVGTKLVQADLNDTNLDNANLRNADLRSANLDHSIIDTACFTGAKLSGARNIPERLEASLQIVPQVGAFDGFKKAGGKIVRLRIPAKARRSNGTERKCRAEYAKVISITGGKKEAVSRRGGVYIVGEITRCDEWNEDRWATCGGGIHFFLTRQEAERYPR